MSVIVFVALQIARESGVNPVVFLSLTSHPKPTVLRTLHGLTVFAFLGVGGGDHEGSDLTDAILLYIYNWKNQSGSLLTIPRDIWSSNMQDKINSAYHYGKRDTYPYGLFRREIENLTGLSVQYITLLDFSQFVSGIDAIGGLDVFVSEGFTDTQYPISGKENDLCGGDISYLCRYETVVFQKGLQRMDGQTALKFVRSRHAIGDSGTDFSRGVRQQEILSALVKKIIDFPSWISKERMQNMYQIIRYGMKSDITVGEMPELVSLLPSITKMKRVSLENVITVGNPNAYHGRYVLIPALPQEEFKKYIQKEAIGE